MSTLIFKSDKALGSKENHHFRSGTPAYASRPGRRYPLAGARSMPFVKKPLRHHEEPVKQRLDFGINSSYNEDSSVTAQHGRGAFVTRMPLILSAVRSETRAVCQTYRAGRLGPPVGSVWLLS